MNGDAEELIRKAVELAKSGDVQMLRFLLDRILPKERLIKIDIPLLEYADDVIEAQSSVTTALAEGRITPTEAAALSNMIANFAKMIDVAEIEHRLDAMEKRLKSESS